MLKVSAFYLEKQKSFIPKKTFFRLYCQDTSKRWRVPSQFSRRFWFDVERKEGQMEKKRKIEGEKIADYRLLFSTQQLNIVKSMKTFSTTL